MKSVISLSELEPQLVPVHYDSDATAARGKLPEQYFVREVLCYLAVYEPLYGPRAQLLVVTLLRYISPRFGCELDRDLLDLEPLRELPHHLVHDLFDYLFRERAEVEHRVKPVPELGAEVPLNSLCALVFIFLFLESDRPLAAFPRPCVRGQDEDYLPEVHLPPV